jgi:quercetin dioxygenase-like cupin family protein
MQILKVDDRVYRSSSPDWFTGTVWLEEVALPAAPSRLRAYRVTFGPGARTAWHTHPIGQALDIVSGIGRVQSAGGPVQTVRPGDTVLIAPGELHWHGAAPSHAMVHLALHEMDQNGQEVEWAKQVTDVEYNAG